MHHVVSFVKRRGQNEFQISTGSILANASRNEKRSSGYRLLAIFNLRDFKGGKFMNYDELIKTLDRFGMILDICWVIAIVLTLDFLRLAFKLNKVLNK